MQRPTKACTPRTDDLYDLFSLRDLDLYQGRYASDLYDLYDLYDLAHVAGWEPYNLHCLGRVSWVGSVLTQTLCSIPQRQVMN